MDKKEKVIKILVARFAYAGDVKTPRCYEVAEEICEIFEEQGQRIKQARQETARVIFEEAEMPCIHYGSRKNRWVKRCCDDCWQSLKDKFTP